MQRTASEVTYNLTRSLLSERWFDPWHESAVHVSLCFQWIPAFAGMTVGGQCVLCLIPAWMSSPCLHACQPRLPLPSLHLSLGCSLAFLNLNQRRASGRLGCWIRCGRPFGCGITAFARNRRMSIGSSASSGSMASGIRAIWGR